MAKIMGGHLVGKYLKEVENIDIVFGISGGHIEAVLDSFTEYKIRTIDVRHEQAAAMMAHAWSVYTGKPGVCFLTAGPGFANGLTGIANAYLDNAPLVVLCGRHPLRDDLKGALQEINQMDIVHPITKWAATCYDPKRIPEYLSIAFRYAVEGRPGPVFLELPPDILGVKIEESLAPMPRRTTRKYTVHPDDADLKAAAQIINNAKNPLFIGGSGVRFSGKSDALKAFIEKTGIPFMLMNYGRGELPDSHSHSVMDMGSVGLMFGLPQTDVLIAAGLRFNWLLMSGSLIPAATKVVRIDIDPHEIDRNRMADAGLVGDVGSVLEQLTPLADKKDHSAWSETLKAAGRSLLDYELRIRETATVPIHPVRLVAQIQKVVGDDTVFVTDGGDTNYFGLAFETRQKAGVIAAAAGLFGCLGTGIPFGMAAKLARPDKKVVVLNGDGSFGFNAMEFDTMVRHNIPVVVVINNDCAWGMIKHSQELSIGADRLQCAELGVRHYEKVVEGLGGHGEFVTKDEEIIPALERAFASGKPACVNVMTDPTVTSPATPLFYQALKME
ncbi:MAG TPA: thiamine pyrophosphate-binding protein [Smithella sp.]|nr:thiamine pyrophosphate-binding protein [Smithella sp.]HOE32060.1 thiamine pyrophosphate-binding protein [Smithella sp.]HOX98170.1 thiamine pyrophosphate-binding protein [Smithella sp.]HPX29551.1 thiamine pyrophosphate-binding protein [Smithella sp.]HQC17766.1 thiamine pyrophosphate-binding protein [Smithella sp.]